jgi:Na+/H+ antiporter NhaC
MNTTDKISAGRGLSALSPVAVFLLVYLAVSLYIGDFYRMPLSVAILAASVWSVMIYRGHSLTERIETFSRAAGHSNIMYMIWIFVLAGAFASLAESIGAVDATVSLALSVFPSQLVAPMLFFTSCFMSLAVGTSVGTVVALTPLAVALAQSADGNVPFLVAAVLGGAFFGDNLSFISDTTIAATRSQGCSMADKFNANLWIALPAALVTLAIYIIIGTDASGGNTTETNANPLLIVPYLVVIAAALAGRNVTIVLSLGIATALAFGSAYGYGAIEMAGFMGKGINSMGELIVITLMAAGMLGIIKAAGGIQYLLRVMTARIHGRRGAQAVMALLAGIVNLCTANNTVAIITVGGITRDIADRYGVDRRKSASLLDSASCVVQCLIPYGAQTLLAASLAGISPAAPFPYLYYPWALSAAIALSIIFMYPRHLNRRGGNWKGRK